MKPEDLLTQTKRILSDNSDGGSMLAEQKNFYEFMAVKEVPSISN